MATCLWTGRRRSFGGGVPGRGRLLQGQGGRRCGAGVGAAEAGRVWLPGSRRQGDSGGARGGRAVTVERAVEGGGARDGVEREEVDLAREGRRDRVN